MTKITTKQKSKIREKYSYGYALDLYKPFKYEEEKFNLKLEKNIFYIVRFDGKDMAKDFKKKKEPIVVSSKQIQNCLHLCLPQCIPYCRGLLSFLLQPLRDYKQGRFLSPYWFLFFPL